MTNTRFTQRRAGPATNTMGEVSLAVETLTPKLAAGFASAVYKPEYLSLALKKEIFDGLDMSNSGPKNTEIKSVTGARLRLISAEHNRGIAAQGSRKWQKHLFFVFRGTNIKTFDVLTDARLGYQRLTSCEPVHIGFDQAFQGMIEQLENFLRDKPRDCTVHCIGHSLGGALASLAAHWLRDKKAWRKDKVKLYTFGCPRVGGTIFAKKTTSLIGIDNIYRVYNQYDPVPCSPAFPYVHAPYALGGSGKKSMVCFMAPHPHDMGSYEKAVGNKTWKDLEDRKPMTFSRLLTRRKGVSYAKGALDRITFPFSQIGRLIGVAATGGGLVLHTPLDKLIWAGIEINKRISGPKVDLTLDCERGIFENLGIPYEPGADMGALLNEVNVETERENKKLGEEVKDALKSLPSI